MPDIAARQVCETALRLLGVVDPEQPMHAHMADAALAALNSLIDSWATERLLTYTRPKIPLALVPGRGLYTWGLGGDIPGEPPVRLELCMLAVGGMEWPVAIADQTTYESCVTMKGLSTSWPTVVYLEDTRPVARLHIWTVPTLPYTLHLLPWTAQSPYEHFDHVMSWPNGYLRAFQYNLAVDLAPQYEREPSPTVFRIADESKRLLGNVNVEVGHLSMDYGGMLRGQNETAVVDLPSFHRGWAS